MLAQSAPPTAEGEAPAPAQEASGPDVADDGGANQAASADIVVTALKQGQTSLQAPATISVLEPQALAAKNIVAGNQLNGVVPGLTMSVGVGGLPGTSFRGLGSNSAVFNVEPSVAEYIDGVYMPHVRDYVAPLYDVDHIEFIKGTQSTLLGKNTSLGAISIVNKRPGKQFGAMALAVIEAHRLDTVEARKRPCQAGGGILAAGKQNDCAGRHGRAV